MITVSRREQLIRSPGSLQTALVESSEPTNARLCQNGFGRFLELVQTGR